MARCGNMKMVFDYECDCCQLVTAEVAYEGFANICNLDYDQMTEVALRNSLEFSFVPRFGWVCYDCMRAFEEALK